MNGVSVVTWGKKGRGKGAVGVGIEERILGRRVKRITRGKSGGKMWGKHVRVQTNAKSIQEEQMSNTQITIIQG